MAKVDIFDTFTAFTERAPAVLRAAAYRGAHRTAPRVLARMQAAAPRLTGAMAAKLTADGGLVGIFDDPEEASVALFNEYSPNHQPFMRPALQSEGSGLIASVTEEVGAAEAELAE